MKPVAITLRIDLIKKFNEKRDSLDRRWISFLKACSLFPIYIPNDVKAAELILSTIDVQGIIFSGGNTLTIFEEGDAPERDKVETFLIEWAFKNAKPILGICRGMQFIQTFFGIPLYEVEGHINKHHTVEGKSCKRVVNSYHKYGSFETIDEIEVLYRTKEGVIEAISHSQKPIKALMWHPERTDPFDLNDISFVKALFNV